MSATALGETITETKGWIWDPSLTSRGRPVRRADLVPVRCRWTAAGWRQRLKRPDSLGEIKAECERLPQAGRQAVNPGGSLFMRQRPSAVQA